MKIHLLPIRRRIPQLGGTQNSPKSHPTMHVTRNKVRCNSCWVQVYGRERITTALCHERWRSTDDGRNASTFAAFDALSHFSPAQIGQKRLTIRWRSLSLTQDLSPCPQEVMPHLNHLNLAGRSRGCVICGQVFFCKTPSTRHESPRHFMPHSHEAYTEHCTPDKSASWKAYLLSSGLSRAFSPLHEQSSSFRLGYSAADRTRHVRHSARATCMLEATPKGYRVCKGRDPSALHPATYSYKALQFEPY